MPDRETLAATSSAAWCDGVADDYDHLPYISMPIVHTQPARLAALAQIFGRAAPAADKGRVLEIGCAGGGNIIPLAVRFPDMRFIGFDLSPQHVRDGQARIAELRLPNIEIKQADVAAVDFGDARFDYIICHGVYSWVPAAAQDAILRLCGRHLDDNGIASISYNVLPGWHLRNVVRDICLQHAGDGRPHERVARARAVLRQLGEATPATSPYGNVVGSEAKRLATMPSSYLLGEFLATYNTPCHFAEFEARASAHGIGYLCEGDVPSSSIAVLAPRAVESIRALAGDDPVEAQQQLDNFTGRAFRRSVLVRLDRNSKNTAGPATDRLDGLHFAGSFARVGDKDGETRFKDHRGRSLKATSAASARMLQLLGDRYPSTASLEELTAGGTHDGARLRGDLLKLIVNGRVSIASLPLVAGKSDVERPTAWPLARADAGLRQPWVSSLGHMPVLLDPRSRFLVQQMDGDNDRRALAAMLAKTFGIGDVPDHPPASLDEKTSARAIADVDRAIAYLARHAVLLPP